jgi:hypothetical protein
MSTLKFLQDHFAGATEGYVALFQRHHPRFVPVDRLDEAAALLTEAGMVNDIWYGVGLLARQPVSGRGTAEDIAGIGSFWLDVDCLNPLNAKAHKQPRLPQSREEAFEFLSQLPWKPSTIVNTGNGLHAYWKLRSFWRFRSDADRAKAAELSRALQRHINALAMSQHGWKLDATSDLARLLRAPGTFNHKNGVRLPVEIFQTSDERYEPADFEGLLVSSPPTPKPFHADEDEADFQLVVGECSFLRHCRDDAAGLPEPEWYKGLSIISRCKDGRRLAHELSRSDPRYDFAETEAKIDQARSRSGPRTCRNIREEGGEPFCAGCRWWGKITSPIQLGYPRTLLLKKFVYVASTKSLYDIATLERYDKEAFSDFFGHLAGKAKGSLARNLLRNPHLAKASELTYVPDGERLIGNDDQRKFNIWRDPGITPVEGDPSVFLNHFEYLIPEPNERDHVLNFLAHILQKPLERINHALLIQGKQGVGKSYVGEVMRWLLGDSNVALVGTSELHSDWSGFLEGKRLILIEELMAGGRLELSNKLKPWITQEKIRVNEKYVPMHDIENRAAFVALTNHEDAIYIPDDDRRFFVCFSPAEKRPKEYYDDLFAWSKTNLGVILGYLQHRDISAFNAKSAPPITEAKRQMIETSLPPLEGRLRELLSDGDPPFDRELVTLGGLMIQLATEVKGLTHWQMVRALKKLGFVRLRRMRLGTGIRTPVYAVRNVAHWVTAQDNQIINHLGRI